MPKEIIEFAHAKRQLISNQPFSPPIVGQFHLSTSDAVLPDHACDDAVGSIVYDDFFLVATPPKLTGHLPQVHLAVPLQIGTGEIT